MDYFRVSFILDDSILHNSMFIRGFVMFTSIILFNVVGTESVYHKLCEDVVKYLHIICFFQKRRHFDTFQGI